VATAPAAAQMTYTEQSRAVTAQVWLHTKFGWQSVSRTESAPGFGPFAGDVSVSRDIERRATQRPVLLADRFELDGVCTGNGSSGGPLSEAGSSFDVRFGLSGPTAIHLVGSFMTGSPCFWRL
jgi:hypothetical protein